ncbi:hypothetical protein I315_00451 [Cryptococcus gattii Ru294]|uniref:Uncharacterized protein n=2 Tax=Cryptococcus gattii TaxID=37769 RepID=E6R3Y2_CRYGW|nr:Hypothetical Protein CGB_D4550C [Cryptococcus gattii WM276]KIR57286.1 hypothetical protein I315_00451 [Cryptococcus gattii Ru294]KIR80703.1 hypothetical protein I306_02158 [Cryptococcus gattii EJB2]KIY35561.1 hypothetical protein I305_01810 [Cryptococcus gattii E566]KJE04409.1 hypothetical protein I311_01891 [Cryptococcus gattii NT-10]ADV21804.1 Hypothetical Protein CGB_D4550C [Cryptococcus gattii WM276]
MHQPDGHFLGIAVVSVDTQVDAERLRVEYNGKVIDHTNVDCSLLERQRANLQKSRPVGQGKASIMRIQPSIPSKDTTRRPRKSKADKAAAKSNVGAASKVSRAKKKLNDSAMDVDEDLTFENTANHGQGYWKK